jgi:sigma-E factor negative regulatory protein RseA
MKQNPFAPKGSPEARIAPPPGAASREAASVGADTAPKGSPEARIAPPRGAASREAASVGADISRLMDGEVDDAEFERCVAELRSGEAMEAWVCYHVIGDSLRGAHGVSAGFASRFHSALAAEPTVLAPPRERIRASQPATFAWAVAATLAAVTVVGYTAFSMVDVPPTAIAKAREAATMRAGQVRPPADVASEYLLAHQEFSPAMVIQSGAPYLRSATATAVEPSRKP